MHSCAVLSDLYESRHNLQSYLTYFLAVRLFIHVSGLITGSERKCLFPEAAKRSHCRLSLEQALKDCCRLTTLKSVKL